MDVKRGLAHKRDTEVKLQAWNLRDLPDELSRSLPPHRLFIARDGYWRGYFVMEPWVTRNPVDKARPWTVLFDPTTWTEIKPLVPPKKSVCIGSCTGQPTECMSFAPSGVLNV